MGADRTVPRRPEFSHLSLTAIVGRQTGEGHTREDE